MKKTLLSFLLIVLLINLDIYSQSTNVNCYGGTNDDYYISTVFSTDSSFFLTLGASNSINGDITNSLGNDDIWICKFDSTSQLLWSKNFGGSLDEEGFKIKNCYNDFIFLGTSESNDYDVGNQHGNGDAWIVKIDSTGLIKWELNIGGSDYEVASDFIIQDSLIYIVGQTSSNNFDFTNNHGNSDLFLSVIDTSGNLLFTRLFGGSDDDAGTSISIRNNILYITGWTFSTDGNVSFNHGEQDVWLLKVNLNGNLIQEKTFGGSEFEQSNLIIPNSDNKFYIIANTSSFDDDVSNFLGDEDAWIILLDSSLNIIKEKCFGGTSVDFLSNAILSSSSNLLLLGQTSSSDVNLSSNYGDMDAWFLELDSTLNVVHSYNFGGSYEDMALNCLFYDGVKLFITGYTYSNNYDIQNNHSVGFADGYTADINCLFLNTNNIPFDVFQSKEILYPNPTNGSFNIYLPDFEIEADLIIFDSFGKCVYKTHFNQSDGFNSNPNLESGLYTCYIKTFENEYVKKLIIIK